MKLITDKAEPDFYMECNIGHRFWADAIFGDNMYYCCDASHGHHIPARLAECPVCGEIEDEQCRDKQERNS